MVGTRREINRGRRLEIGACPTMGGTLDGVSGGEEEVVATAGGGVLGEAAVRIPRRWLLHGVDKEWY